MSMISKQQFDFAPKAHSTRMLEQELEEMKTRLAKLEEIK